jgi:hypothetical protein
MKGLYEFQEQLIGWTNGLVQREGLLSTVSKPHINELILEAHRILFLVPKS